MSRVLYPRVLPRSTSLPLRPLRSPLQRRFLSTPPPPPPQTLGARMKALSKEYGYAALGVYLGLSALDFPICFLGVRLVGTEKIGEYEEVIVKAVKPHWIALREKVGIPVRELTREELKEQEEVREREVAERMEGKGASIWTELALAYAIHKSLIFIRVPITAAVTPKVVKVLRSWGWDIGKKGTPKIGRVGKGKKELDV
ncbi:hypothetical protein EX30DRAFT_188087 [Ascodesmis nigricans]|uniref:DUF1279 domain-containing protein n=1 Tax=Ascodesmis nigricans TaxID=341454 RepID=A0A4S2N0T0_9PEZI|nr:hypothetical protein EX30DRAFT_188087 [Ascodesmis nigricans]